MFQEPDHVSSSLLDLFQLLPILLEVHTEFQAQPHQRVRWGGTASSACWLSCTRAQRGLTDPGAHCSPLPCFQQDSYSAGRLHNDARCFLCLTCRVFMFLVSYHELSAGPVLRNTKIHPHWDFAIHPVSFSLLHHPHSYLFVSATSSAKHSSLSTLPAPPVQSLDLHFPWDSHN